VPTYEYECAACRRVFEIRQRISEPPLTTCDVCGGAVHRLLSAAPFILKGEGWYVTDYPSESRKKAREAEKTSSASADTSAKTETKSESKSESKSKSKSDSKSSGAKSDGGSGTSGASSGATASSKPD
jgi:putative FmdB family regulatory protein